MRLWLLGQQEARRLEKMSKSHHSSKVGNLVKEINGRRTVSGASVFDAVFGGRH